MNINRMQKIMFLRMTAGLAALWLIFRAPPVGPLIREQGWRQIPPSVPLAMAGMLICWLLARREKRRFPDK